MARSKGQAIVFDEFPEVSITWGPHGRFTVKKKGVTMPPFFVAPIRWKWQIQNNPSLSPIGEPFEERENALREAAKLANRKT